MNDKCCEKMIKRIEDLGKCQILLLKVLDNDAFENLSKHNNYWDSPDENSADRLDETRMRLSYIQDQLHDIMNLLNDEDEQ